MTEKAYGAIRQNQVGDEVDRHLEELSFKGFTIITDLYSNDELKVWRDKIDHTYQVQETAFGRDRLASINELDVCRIPLLYDDAFIDMAAHPRVVATIRRILGEWFILNLQNAIINRPQIEHHQSHWHRDLQNQNFVISTPLAINALHAIDEFSEETGGTYVLPFSHKSEKLPSDSYIKGNQVGITAPAGSAILFDAMIFHRAGSNRSQKVRRGVNHLYTASIIKQPIRSPAGFCRPLGFG